MGFQPSPLQTTFGLRVWTRHMGVAGSHMGPYGVHMGPYGGHMGPYGGHMWAICGHIRAGWTRFQRLSSGPPPSQKCKSSGYSPTRRPKLRGPPINWALSPKSTSRRARTHPSHFWSRATGSLVHILIDQRRYVDTTSADCLLFARGSAAATLALSTILASS